MINLLVYHNVIVAGHGFPLMLDDDDYGTLEMEIFDKKEKTGQACIISEKSKSFYTVEAIYNNILSTSDRSCRLMILRTAGSSTPAFSIIQWDGLMDIDCEQAWSEMAGCILK